MQKKILSSTREIRNLGRKSNSKMSSVNFIPYRVEVELATIRTGALRDVDDYSSSDSEETFAPLRGLLHAP